MISLGGKTVLLGGFHDHWARADMENPALFLAALNYYHYDFVTLQDGPEFSAQIARTTAVFSDKIKIYPGREEGFSWGHVVTVDPKAPPPNTQEPDPYTALSGLKKSCAMVFLAHPTYLTTFDKIYKTGIMDRLMDEGVIDGVNLINTDGFDEKGHQEMIRWYRRREKAGKHTPIVGGWDLHMPAPPGEVPPVLYGPNFPPGGHFESPLGNRSLVFAEENTLDAIMRAVATADVVIEDLATGELLGPERLVKFLKENDFRAIINHLDAERDSVSLRARTRWTLGGAAEFAINKKGTVLFPKSLTATERLPVESDAVVQRHLPVFLERDAAYCPVAWRGADGTERIWAVEALHPVQFEVLPTMGEGGPAVELAPKIPFAGTASIHVKGLLDVADTPIESRTLLPVTPEKAGTIPFSYEFSVVSTSGVKRNQTGYLTFIGARRFASRWEDIPEIAIDNASYVPKFSYGANRPYPGPSVFSTRLKLAWTPECLMLRADVTDPVHHQPHIGHYAYNADCLQLAIDPLLRRDDITGRIYAFNLALTSTGPELFRTWAPRREASPSFTPPPDNVSLGATHLSVEKKPDGLVYTLSLPWRELAPLAPTTGARFGIYLIMMNNNGDGLIDTMHWPIPIDGMWLIPNRWGVVNLVD